MIHDTIADMLARIRNAQAAGLIKVEAPYSKEKGAILCVLQSEGYISSFKIFNCKDVPARFRRKATDHVDAKEVFDSAGFDDIAMSDGNAIEQKIKSALNGSRLAYVEIALKYRNGKPVIVQIDKISKPSRRVFAPKTLKECFNGTGIYVLSTSCGIMTDRMARIRGIGGEVLVRVF